MDKKLKKKNKPIKKSNIIDIGSSLINIKRKNSNEMLVLAPSELDYKPKKCQRCFYLEKNHKIGPKDFPPPVFSRFALVTPSSFPSIERRRVLSQCFTLVLFNSCSAPLFACGF